MPIYYFPNGRPCSHPTSYEKACSANSRVYDDGVKCEACGQVSTKYTKTQGCVRCAALRSINLYNMYKGVERLIWTDENNIHWGEPQGGLVQEIPQKEWEEMEHLVDLAKSDPDFKIGINPCKQKGHYDIKYLGKCYQCQQAKLQPTPRQQAIAKGEQWYTPEQACPKCGERAQRNVNNGTCRGCVPERPTRESATTVMMRTNPDMVISREDARSLDMTVYRTGEACSRGHEGWRYVSTGNCIDCLRGKE